VQIVPYQRDAVKAFFTALVFSSGDLLADRDSAGDSCYGAGMADDEMVKHQRVPEPPE
jgi:hypothetical protein